MISLFYFHKSATELALLGVNTGELSLSWSKNDPLARGQPFFPCSGYMQLVESWELPDSQ